MRAWAFCAAAVVLASCARALEQTVPWRRPSRAERSRAYRAATGAHTDSAGRMRAIASDAAGARDTAPGDASGVDDVQGVASPLWMITQEEEVTDLIEYLQAMRGPIEANPLAEHELHFSRVSIERARAVFEAELRRGEERQHALCSLLGQRLLGRYYLQSVVVGELPRTRHRFELSQRIDPTTLLSETDLALGTRVLSQHRVASNGQWVEPKLVASFVEYHPTVTDYAPGGARAPAVGAREPDPCIYRMISRIKAEQEIFNKVCDEIFDLDRLVRDLSRADKDLASLGHFVKDVFGIKVVVGTVEQALEVQAAIEAISFSDDELAGVEVRTEGGPPARLNFIETKNYLGEGAKSNSGWECLKSVFEWNGGIFEVQIQPLINYCLERERLTKQSHDAYKQKRERVRDQVAASVPLFGFYRDILRTLFIEPPNCDGLQLPSFNNVKVSVRG